MTETLYEQDFFRWTQEQAQALRTLAEQGANLPVDWVNVAEEIESLGRSDRREITSRLATIAEHLLKLQHSPASAPRVGWRETVFRERLKVAKLIAESPSLRPELPELARSGWDDGSKLAGNSLALHTPEQLLSDWFPPESE